MNRLFLTPPPSIRKESIKLRKSIQNRSSILTSILLGIEISEQSNVKHIKRSIMQIHNDRISRNSLVVSCCNVILISWNLEIVDWRTAGPCCHVTLHRRHVILHRRCYGRRPSFCFVANPRTNIIIRVPAADANDSTRTSISTEAFEAVWAFLSQVPIAHFSDFEILTTLSKTFE